MVIPRTPPGRRPRAEPRYNHLRPSRQRRASTPSPSWKETLKQSCIERARRKRSEVILNRKRQLNPIARMLVEEELMETGVSVVSDYPDSQSTMATSDSMECNECQEDYAINEEELYELMQEVEEELQRDEAEEIHAMEQLEQWHHEELEAQIAEYEAWESAPDDMRVVEEEVACPMCSEGVLIQENDSFICSHRVHEGCPFWVARPNQHFCLTDLRERLGQTYADHAMTCPAPIQFEIEDLTTSWGPKNLIAVCCECHANMKVV